MRSTSLLLGPMAQALRSYVHEAARLAIESMSIEMVAEIRTVTTIFCNIQGLEEDFEEGSLERVQVMGNGTLYEYHSITFCFSIYILF